MKTFTKDLKILSELASVITLDNLSQVESIIMKLKNTSVKTEKIYETILQCYLFCGFPATIEALIIFKKYFPKYYKKKFAYNIGKFRKSGMTNCKLVYRNNFRKLIENMEYYSPELKDWIIIEGYGKVLGRTGLSLLDREYINVSILVTKLYENQLNSHLRGCLNLGATKHELNSLFNRLQKISGIKNISSGKKLLKSV